MKKKDLLNFIDKELLDKLFGFCYSRTSCSYEAEALCSDIVFAIVKAANGEGDIESMYSFVWRIARNTYADYSEKKTRKMDESYMGDPDDVFSMIADEESDEDNIDLTLLQEIYREIVFLTRAYREVMVSYYLDGKSTAEIAKEQKCSETAIRQRLFSARETIRKGVNNMENKKPVALQNINVNWIGTGNPMSGDPREVCERQLSYHIVWLCRNNEMSAKEISEVLNIPMPYVEEELEIQCRGKNGKYGLLKKLDNGKYVTNFILLDKDKIQALHKIYIDRMAMMRDTVVKYIKDHEKEYMSFPYLNKKIDLNLVLWQQICDMAQRFEHVVGNLLKEKYFVDVSASQRPFSVYAYEDYGVKWGCGWDGVAAKNVCGYSSIHLDNIYISKIKAHFHCGLNVSNDAKIQIAIRAINGLDVKTLLEDEKEIAAKAIECGYVYREDDMLYTKILVCNEEDISRLFSINYGLEKTFEKVADAVASEVASFVRKNIPERLWGDYIYANMLASIPCIDSLVDSLIDKGMLTPPENGVGAEGCWMAVKK